MHTYPTQQERPVLERLFEIAVYKRGPYCSRALVGRAHGVCGGRSSGLQLYSLRSGGLHKSAKHPADMHGILLQVVLRRCCGEGIHEARGKGQLKVLQGITGQFIRDSWPVSFQYLSSSTERAQIIACTPCLTNCELFYLAVWHVALRLWFVLQPC